MFRKVLNLIMSLAGGIKLDIGEASIKAAILQGLDALKAAAVITPVFWDDLVVRLAIALVNSDAWNAVWELITRQNPVPAPSPVVAASPMSDADLESIISAKISALTAEMAA